MWNKFLKSYRNDIIQNYVSNSLINHDYINPCLTSILKYVLVAIITEHGYLLNILIQLTSYLHLTINATNRIVSPNAASVPINGL